MAICMRFQNLMAGCDRTFFQNIIKENESASNKKAHEMIMSFPCLPH